MRPDFMLTGMAWGAARAPRTPVGLAPVHVALAPARFERRHGTEGARARRLQGIALTRAVKGNGPDLVPSEVARCAARAPRTPVGQERVQVQPGRRPGCGDNLDVNFTGHCSDLGGASRLSRLLATYRIRARARALGDSSFQQPKGIIRNDLDNMDVIKKSTAYIINSLDATWTSTRT